MSLSVARAKIIQAFLEDTSREQYGFGLMHETKVKSGSLYPILESLENKGWIEGRDEEIDEQVAGRPKRRMYRLTKQGEEKGREELEQFYRELRVTPAPQFQRPGLEGV